MRRLFVFIGLFVAGLFMLSSESNIQVLCMSENYLITKKRGIYYINRRPQITASENNGMPQSVRDALAACNAENEN